MPPDRKTYGTTDPRVAAAQLTQIAEIARLAAQRFATTSPSHAAKAIEVAEEAETLLAALTIATTLVEARS